MSRDARPRRRVHARYRLALVGVLFPRRRLFEDAARGLTRPSILRGAILGRPVSARAVEQLLARLGAT